MAEEAVVEESEGTVLTAQENTDAAEESPDQAKADQSAEAAPEGEDEAKAESKPDGDDAEPIEYGDFAMPEGFELDEAAMESALPIFKELRLDQEQAQKLVDMHVANEQRKAESFGAQYKELTDKWVSGIHEMWGPADSPKFKENMTVAAKAVEFGGPEFRDALNETGAGNHPAMAEFLHRVGKALSEDVMGGKPSQGQKTPLEQRLYPSMYQT